jgi:hypothetical protein
MLSCGCPVLLIVSNESEQKPIFLVYIGSILNIFCIKDCNLTIVSIDHNTSFKQSTEVDTLEDCKLY